MPLNFWCCSKQPYTQLANPTSLGNSLEGFENGPESGITLPKSIITERTSLIEHTSSLLSSDKQSIKNRTSLPIQVGLNWARDFAWTWFSYCHLNYRIQATHIDNYDWKGQWFGQQIYGTASMALISPLIIAIYAIYCFKNKRYLETKISNLLSIVLKDIVIYLSAAAAAIFTWDFGQRLGIHVGQKSLTLSPHNAAFFACLFTGSFEGFTQFSIILLLSIALQKPARNTLQTQPSQEAKRILLGLLLSITINAIPGVLWQIVYTACVIGSLGPLLTSLLVACTVAIGNASTTPAAQQVVNFLFPLQSQHVAKSPCSQQPQTTTPNETSSSDSEEIKEKHVHSSLQC